MSMDAVSTSHATALLSRESSGERGAFGDFFAGQVINIKVQRRLDEQHYIVVLRGESHKVLSQKSLPVGETIDAVVVRATDKLELRQITSGSTARLEQNDIRTEQIGLPQDNDVAALASFYKCELSSKEIRQLQAFVDQASAPGRMALAGLFLNKRGADLEEGLLNAVYKTLENVGAASMQAAQRKEETNESDNAQQMSVGAIANAMRQTVSIDDGLPLQEDAKQTLPVRADIDLASGVAVNLPQMLSDPQSDDTGRDRNMRSILELLNEVDSQGTGVRYGTLPVLIDGQLVELELVLFQHRQSESDVEPIRRLVMSVNTKTLGTVEISAEALNNHLLVRISGGTLEQAEALASYAQDVRELAAQFGWTVDAVGYEVKTSDGRLAQRVMEHSIRQGVIDHVW